MAKIQVELDQPTKGSIDKLFRELGSGYYYLHDALEVKQASAAYDELEAELLNSPKLRELKRAKDAAYKKADKRNKARTAKISKVRKMYWSRGLTPAVKQAIIALVDEINAEES